MKSVNVDKNEILGILKENLTKHIADYDKAMIGYAEDVKAAIVTAMEYVEKGDLEVSGLFTSLETPSSYAKQYEDVIGMLEMARDETIEVSTDEYRQFVLDEWQWKHHFLSNTQKYLG